MSEHPARSGRPPRVRLRVESLEERAVPAVLVSYQLDQDWGSGYQATVRLENTGPAAVSNWRLEFDLPDAVNSIWDARIALHDAGHYTLTGAGWNDTLAAGGSVSFGFVATPGTRPVTPTNFVLNGETLGDEGTPPQEEPPPPPPPPPTPEPPPVGSADVQFRVSSDWGSGFTGDVTLRNSGSTPLNGWTVSFDFAGDITSVWNGGIVSRNGTRYTVRGADWNQNLAAGASTSFGFTASPGGSGAVVTNLTLNGSTPTDPTPNPSPNPTVGSVWPSEVFAPYVDVTLYPTFDLSSATQNAGVEYFNLAFITADPAGKPAWGGYAEYAVGSGEFHSALLAQINTLREAGGDVAVSFGGAANREIAEIITDVDALTASYRTVVDAYGLRRVDFDIEGAAAADRTSVDRRWKAVAKLQSDLMAAGKPLEVWLTLPVLPSGLTHDGRYVVQSALRHGVALAGVNVMAMDYGDSAAPNPSGRMGDYAIDAATSTHGQLKTLYGTSKSDAELWAMIGVTPMIGLNDVTTEVFDPQEARELLAFAEEKGLGMLSFWSLNRDRANPRGAIGYVEPFSSSLAQQPFDFSKIFVPFTG